MSCTLVFAIKCKDGFDNKWNNKYVEVTEQVGRLGCFGFMIINIPGTWFGWWSDEALAFIIGVIMIMKNFNKEKDGDNMYSWIIWFLTGK